MEKSNLPWSIKGISSEARQIAKERATEAGQPMGSWLSDVIRTISQLERAEAENPGQPAPVQPKSPTAQTERPMELESERPYDTAGYKTSGKDDDIAILAQRVAKAERWTAKSVGPLRQAIDAINRRLDVLERPDGQSRQTDDPLALDQAARRRWRS
ncbi:MAG: hypothetical protein FJX52_01995 [Alphaproteobacteria bacterium]|nr:hypothetical protein [Alphaproteobacteria bacterium]